MLETQLLQLCVQQLNSKYSELDADASKRIEDCSELSPRYSKVNSEYSQFEDEASVPDA